jgi:integrase
MECLRLRVKDIEFTRREILVREGKGNKDPGRCLQVTAGRRFAMPGTLKLRSAGGTAPRFGPPQRFHLHESVLQRAIHDAARKAVFPRRLARIPRDTASRRIWELLGHRDVKTTMIYTHVLNRDGHGVQSPADRLLAGGSSALARAGKQRNNPVDERRS